MSGDERGDDVDRGRDGRGVLYNFWLGWQATPSTFQAVCSYNYKIRDNRYILELIWVVLRSNVIIKSKL